MKKIYFDNAASSFPKAPQVGAEMARYIEEIGCNVNRSGYEAAYGAAEMVLDTREGICRFFNGPDSRQVILTASVTASLNFILKGLLKKGDHVLTSSMEHNAVIRPLVQLAEKGICFDAVPCNEQGELDPDRLEAMIKPQTSCIVLTHASNVCGTLLPIAQIGAICRRRGIPLVVDSAQTAGGEEIDMQAMAIDALAFTGHKGLLGPQGIGGFLITEELAQQMEPLIAGGTGSFSHLETMPRLLPDRFEAGTLNLPGIYGLNAALQYVESQGLEKIRCHERALAEEFLKGLAHLEGLRIIGCADMDKQTAVISLDFLTMDNAEIAFQLDSQYGIMTRCGLHCAPRAHKTLHTYPQGTVRFSFGFFNTQTEVQAALFALEQLLKGK